MFFPVFILFIVWIVFQAVSHGGRIALWKGWIVSMLFLPVWLVKGIGSIVLDLRTAGGGVGLACLFLSGTRVHYRFAIMDVLMFGLFAVQLLSGLNAGEVSVGTVPELMRRWLLPYLVGRFFLSSQDDLKKLLPVFAMFMLGLSLYAVVEAFTKINIVNKVLGKSYWILEQGEGYRWGIKRAQGNVDHPIYFGMMMVMIFPWTVEAARSRLSKMGPKWWLVLPVLATAAVVCTASRGAIIACIFCIFITIFFRFPKLRVPFIIMALLGGVTMELLKDQLMEALSKAAGESEESIRYVYIDGKEYEYTGTAHRLLLNLVYARAIEKTGYFGYGARMKGVPIAEEHKFRFGSIDNHYLLFLLTRGWVGVSIFVAMSLLTLFYTGIAAWKIHEPRSTICASLCGGMLGVSLLLMSVWFAPDHGSVWLFTVGFVTCLHTLPSIPRKKKFQQSTDDEEQTQVKPPRRLSRKLVPGHAPIRGKVQLGST